MSLTCIEPSSGAFSSNASATEQHKKTGKLKHHFPSFQLPSSIPLPSQLPIEFPHVPTLVSTIGALAASISAAIFRSSSARVDVRFDSFRMIGRLIFENENFEKTKKP
jgi:hypothetical protein